METSVFVVEDSTLARIRWTASITMARQIQFITRLKWKMYLQIVAMKIRKSLRRRFASVRA